MKKIDRIVVLELEGRVIARCYTGTAFVDAEMTTPALATLVADGAKVLCAVHQRECAKASAG